MAFLGKEYITQRQEGFEDFLKAAGLPDDQVKAFAAFKTTQKVEKDGDTYIFTVTTLRGKKETKFRSGVEFDEHRDNNTIAKTKFVVDGNTIIQTTKSPTNSITHKNEYNGDEMVATLTIDKWDGEAKIYYKAN